jgi:glyoxylate reductase
MHKPRVWVTRRIPEDGLRPLEEFAETTVWEDELPPPIEVIRREVREIDGLLCLLTDPIDAAVIDAAPRLRVISTMAVGYDNIDIAAATRRGILVTNTPGVLTETTADLAFALLIATARNIAHADRFTRAGEWRTWSPLLLCGQDLHHATLGIVGLGRIGTEMARRAKGFSMRVLYHNRSRRPEVEAELGVEYATLDDLLRQSDFVSLHTPLTSESAGLIGARELGLMKPTAVLINTSRGAVVDQRALYDALVSQSIWAAGLDVFAEEPIPADDPLLRLDNVTVLPHIGSASFATRRKMAAMAAANLIAGLRGERPEHLVNPEAAGPHAGVPLPTS